MLQWTLNSPIGKLYLLATSNALKAVHWKKQPVPMASSLKGSDPAVQILAQAVRELEEYFAGRRQKFEIPLDSEGTEFQKKVWGQLRKIPYGKTCSYQDIAKKLKNDKAVRAVGTANGRNPLSIIVPCHRVINASGALGGYAGGLSIKTQLLDLEKKFLA